MKTTENNAEVGVIVARFQTPFLHEGHREIIETVCAAHPRVIIFLGLSPLKCTTNNPYDFGIRKAMIEESYRNVEILYIDDVGNNEVWSKNLDKQIAKTIGPNLRVVLYGSRDSFINSYLGKYPTIELVPSKIISATTIRQRIGIKGKNTQDFREGMCFAIQNQVASFKPCADLAIIDFDKRRVLLAKKPNEDLLRFPGGKIEPAKGDKNAEGAAVREGKEETNLELEVAGYIGSTFVDNWQYRSEQDKLMSFFYVMKYMGGDPKGGSDIEYVCWKNFGEINESEIMREHRPLLSMLNDYFKNEILRLP